MNPFAVKHAYREAFLSTPGVVGLGIGDYKPGCNCLIAYLERPNVVTPEVDFPVVPFVTGPLYRFSQVYSMKYRPYPGGVSVGTYSRRLRSFISGTLGMVVFDGDGPALLGNNHILAGLDTFENPTAEPGQLIWQPGTYFGGSPSDAIARLSKWVPLYEREPNLVDCALASPLDFYDADPEVLGIGRLSTVADAYRGMPVAKMGMVSGFTRSYVMDVDATIRVSYGPVTATLEDQVIIANARYAFARPGDSGSVIVSQDNAGRLLAVGLLSGGSDEVVVANRMATVQKALDFSLR